MRFVESESGVGFLRKGLSSENREAAVVAVVRSGAMAKSLLKMLEGVETVSVWAYCHFVSGEPIYDEFHARDGET